MAIRTFLSSVTDKAAAAKRQPDPLRTWLADELRKSGTHSVCQEFLIEIGVNTLVKLAESIEKESDVVLHIVGDELGSVPPKNVVAELLRHCGEQVFRSRFPILFENDVYLRLTYTQWEAWLAKFYNRDVLPCVMTESHESKTTNASGQGASLPMPENIRLLKPFVGYFIEFDTQAELLDLVQKALLRKLQSGSFSESHPGNLKHATIGNLFIGRDTFLTDLRERFLNERKKNRYPNHLIHGPGGVGKTRAAIEYALRYQDDYAAILFVNGEKPSDLDRGLSELAGVLAVDIPLESKIPELIHAVREWLRKHPGWLLIVDNVDDKQARQAVIELMSDCHNGHLVITGRFMDWGKDVIPLELGVLHPDDAKRFLMESTQGKRQTKPDDDKTARQIAVDDLGQLCLALEQAAAYIGHREISFAEYRRRWQKNEKLVRTWADRAVMKYHEEKEVSLSIATTWQTSVDQLSPDARTLLELLSWLAPDPIPSTITAEIEKSGSLLPREDENREENSIPQKTAESPDMEILLAELRSFSLLQRAMDLTFDSIGQVHRLVQLVTREQLPDCKPTLPRILDAVNQATPTETSDVRTWQALEPLRSHIATVIQHAIDRKIFDPTTRLMNCLGVYFNARCAFPEAESLLRRALDIDEQSYGAEHPKVARDLNNLAQLLHATNRLAEAEPMMCRALDIDEKPYGAEHPNVATKLNNLAQLLQATNRMAEAEPMMRRALDIDEQSYGAEHPKVARDLNNLAQLLQATNRLAEAEPLMRRAMAIDEQSYGAEHPKVAIRINNLAALLKETNRLAEAEPLMRRAIAIDEQSYGAEHPNVATNLNNLAQLLQATNQMAEAELLMCRALAIDEKSFGAKHPKVAIRLNNHAQLLKATNRLEEAEPLMRRALAIFEQSYGAEHPSVAVNLNNLAQLLRARADTTAEMNDWDNRSTLLDEAEPMMRRAMEIDEQSYGAEHPNVARDLNNLAQLLQATNRLEEAEPLMRRALAIFEQSYGAEHPNVATNLNNLAMLLKAKNRLAEAEPMMRRALDIDEQSYGAEHPKVAIDLNNLAQLLQARADIAAVRNDWDNRSTLLAEAVPMMRRAMEIFAKSFGNEHPNTRTVQQNLKALLDKMK